MRDDDAPRLLAFLGALVIVAWTVALIVASTICDDRSDI
jgi:hypothetical protein